ncbi:MAG: ABC transporter ATP-binding protein [Spirochaetales bacterium]|nr:ABC transporter ATP-binding protein [Spirochaetales bacterium]
MRGPGRGGPMHMMKGEKAKNFRDTMKKLLGYLGKYRLRLTIVFLFAVASTIFAIAGPKILGKATTELFNGVMSGSINFAKIGIIILNVLAIYGVSSVFAYVMGWLMSKVAADIAYRFRRDISIKINKMPLSYFDRTRHGEVLSRITNDVDIINQTLRQSITEIITSVVTVFGVMAMMFSIDWRLTLVALLILPMTTGIVSFIVKRSQKYFKEQQKYLGHINGHIEEMFGGHLVMKSFNGEQKSIDEFEKNNKVLFNSAWKAQFLSHLMMPLMRFVSNLGYIAICILGGWLMIRRLITLGDIQAFIQYINNFTRPIMQMANISNILQQTAAAAERVFEFLGEEEEIHETVRAAGDDSPAQFNGHVEFRNVQFAYKPDEPVIRDFSASVKPGQKIAIVGPTGAGKTTMVKLLMRFYDIRSGSILVDGRDIRDFSRRELRNNFGMVLQDTWLYNASILENIRYGRPEAGDEEVFAAARAAHADHFIHTLPEGYHMIINEETANISQGQKQLLTIARAILADPRILILDEATSSVDTRTEVLIQKAMDHIMEGRTSFIIAHRLSTIRNADLILVMNEGDIVEQGRHEELLASGGFYADLYNSQFEPAAAV